MRYSLTSGTGAAIAAILTALLCQGASGQNPPGKAADATQAPAVPMRSSPGDYQGHAQAGALTLAGEFTGHSVVTPLATFTTDDYVAVEVALFGQSPARLTVVHDDFSLRINGKKAVPADLYLLMFKSLKDPSYSPPEPKPSKDDAGVPEVGKAPSDRNPVWHPVPFEVTHLMQQRVEKAALAEGDRALPEAGLLFFPYKGRENGINTVELIYSGPAGKATLALHP